VQALVGEKFWVFALILSFAAYFFLSRSKQKDRETHQPIIHRFLLSIGYLWLAILAGYPHGIGFALLTVGVMANTLWLRRLGAINVALSVSLWVIPPTMATIDAHWTIAPLIILLCQWSGLPVTFVKGQTVWLSAQTFSFPFTLRMIFFPVWLMFVISLAIHFWQGTQLWRNWLKFVAATVAITFSLSLLWSVIFVTTAVTLDGSSFLISPIVWLFVTLSYAFAVAPLAKSFFPSPSQKEFLTSFHFAPRLLLVSLATALFLTCLLMPDFGERKQGRILFDEYHSGWEPINVRYDTTDWRKGTGYTFNRMVFFLSKIYKVSSLHQTITSEVLKDADVLVLKIPTFPYGKSEVEAIKEWVRGGGGLWLIGDHTNVFGSATALNSVASSFGIVFRPDAIYPTFHSLESSHWLEWERPPFLWHPITAGSPHLTLYTSCSLHSPILANRVIVGTHKFSSLADYSKRNFFGEFDRTRFNHMGDYIFCIAKTFGKGRIVALGESTFFSNFGLPEPGTWELALHTVEWLNRKNAAHRKWLAVFFSSSFLILAFFFASRFASFSVVLAFLIDSLPIAFALAFTINNLMRTYASLPSKKIPLGEQVFFLFSGEEHHYRLFIGKAPHDPSENMFHEFFISPQRIGLLPRLIRPNELPKDAARNKAKAVLVTPIVKLKPSQVQKLIDWVREGGRLLWFIDASGWERPDIRDETGVEVEFAVYPFFAPKVHPVERKTEAQKRKIAQRLLSEDHAYQYLSRKLGVTVKIDALKPQDWVSNDEGMSVQCLEIAPLTMTKKGRVLGRLKNGQPAIAVVKLGKGEVTIAPFALTFAKEAFGASLQVLNEQQRLRHSLLFNLLK